MEITKIKPSPPVRIMVIDNSYTFGGAIKSLEFLVRALQDQPFHFILVSGQPESYLKTHFPRSTVRHFRPRLPWVDNRVYKRIADGLRGHRPFFRKCLNAIRYLYWLAFIYPRDALTYYRMGKDLNADLVHLNNILGSQLAGILAAKFLGVPCVAHLRDFEQNHPITRIYARLIDHHVAISSAIRDNLLQIGVAPKKISLVHDAIDLKEFTINVENGYLHKEFEPFSKHLRYGIFGRVVDWKGIQDFIYAAKYVSQKFPEAVAFIVGSRSDGGQAFFDEMKGLVAELGLTRNVIFTGYRQDVAALMKFMDIVVHASKRSEPFGMVLVEAMAMAKPVVATRGGGPLDIVLNGETGLLVEMNDAVALGRAIFTLLSNKNLRQDMGRKGRKRVEVAFNSKISSQKVSSIYRNQYRFE